MITEQNVAGREDSQRRKDPIKEFFTFGLTPEQEDRYRAYKLASDLVIARIGIAFVAVFAAALLINDFILYKISPVFFTHAGVRAIFLVYTAWLLGFTGKTADYRKYDKTEFTWAFIAVIMSLAINFSRPAAFTAHSIVIVVVIFITLFIIPNAFPAQLALSFMLAAGESLIIFSNHGVNPQLVFTILTNIIVATAIAVSCSWMLHSARRREFFAAETARDTRDLLSESEEKYRDLLNYAPAYIYELDVKNGKFLSVNEAVCEALGYTREELLSIKPIDLMEPESRQVFADRLKNNLVGAKTNESIEYRVRKKKGGFIDGAINVRLVKLEDGKPSRVLVVGQDITERKLMERELRSSEERYKTLFNGLIEGFCIIEMVYDAAGRPVDYRFLEINEAFEAQTGLHNAQGKLMRELAPDHEQYWFDIYGRIALTGEPLKFTEEAKALNRWFDVRAFRMGGPESRRVAICFNDISERKRAEEQVSFHAMIMKTMHDAIFSTDDSLNITSWNRGAEEMYGWKEEDVLGKNAYGLLRSSTSGAVRNEQLADLAAKGVSRNETTHYRKDGAPLTVDVSSAALFNERRKITGYVVSNRDVTSRLQAERELRESEERFRTIAERLPIGVAMTRISDSRIIFANPAYHSMVGYGPGELNGMLSPEFYDDPADRVKLIETLNNQGFLKDYQVRLRKRGGAAFWIEATVQLIEYGGEKALMGMSMDITDRKRAEEALKESEQRLKFHFENSPLAVVEWDSDYIVTQWSGEAERMFGWEKDETIGKRIDTLNMIYPDDIPIVNDTMERLSSGEENTVVSSNRNLTKSGSIIECTWYNTIFLDQSGKMKSVMSLVQDITARKKAEEILKRDKDTFERLVNEKTQELVETQVELERAKRLSDVGYLAATVAHELRNPLAAIHLAAYNVRRKAKKPEIEKHLDNIDKKVAESAEIINNLLYYTRLKPPHCETINILELLEEAAEQIEEKGKKEIPVSSNFGRLKELPVEADPLQLKEVFNNILNNSYDAVLPHKGKINISAEDHNGSVRIMINDTGKGIDRDKLAKVFEPFYTTKTKGTGLGLSVCREIMKYHDGSIDIESEPGKGTTVILSLPKKKKGR